MAILVPLALLLSAVLGEEWAERGALPDLADLRESVHADSYQRLADLSTADLVKVLHALGFEDSALQDKGKSVALIQDNPATSITVGGKTLENKGMITLAPQGRSLSIFSCHAKGSSTKDERISFANSWNAQHRFTQAWATDLGLCLQSDLHLCKYDEANLEVLKGTLDLLSASNVLFSESWGRSSRRLSALDDLVARIRSQGGRQHAKGGPLPDLDALASRALSHEAERLAHPSVGDLKEVLDALGFRRAAATEDGAALKVLLADPFCKTSFQGRKWSDKAEAVLAPKGNTVSLFVCIDQDNELPSALKEGFANDWNSGRRFVVASWSEGHGVCLQSDMQLSRFSKANLQLLQELMGTFEEGLQLFHARWMKLLEKWASRRLSFV